MVKDFLAVATSGVGVEWLFNSAWDICYFHQGQLDENTIFTLMLQLMTDWFMIKEEFCWQRDEGEEDVVDDRYDEQEDEELFRYISNVGEESDNDHGDVIDDEFQNEGLGLGQDVDNVQASPVWRSHWVEWQPGCYCTLASSSNQCTWWSFNLLVCIVLWEVGTYCCTSFRLS